MKAIGAVLYVQDFSGLNYESSIKFDIIQLSII